VNEPVTDERWWPTLLKLAGGRSWETTRPGVHEPFAPQYAGFPAAEWTAGGQSQSEGAFCSFARVNAVARRKQALRTSCCAFVGHGPSADGVALQPCNVCPLPAAARRCWMHPVSAREAQIPSERLERPCRDRPHPCRLRCVRVSPMLDQPCTTSAMMALPSPGPL